VEWPETWPLKIMSLDKRSAVSHKKKTKTKPKVNRKVHFEKTPVPQSSFLGESSNTTKQAPTEQVLHEMQNPVAKGTALPHSPIIEEPIDKREAEESTLVGQALEGNVNSNILDIEERHSSEIPILYSETSSLSETTFVDEFQDKLMVSGFVSLLG